MTSLLTQIINPSSKKPFQEYIIEHGIERFSVFVPLSNVALFEEEFSALRQKSKSEIMNLTLSQGGKII